MSVLFILSAALRGPCVSTHALIILQPPLSGELLTALTEVRLPRILLLFLSMVKSILEDLH